MGIWSGNLTFDLFSILVALVVIFLSYLKWAQGYWKRRNVPHIEPSFPFGNAKDVLLTKQSPGDFWKDIYEQLKERKVSGGGFYLVAEPHYMPIDLELIKHILQNDFAHFVNHGMFVNEKDDPLTGHLFLLEDAKWRNLRIKLTPTFTSGKMKMMYPTVLDCSKGLNEVLHEHSVKKEAADIKVILQRFTTDIIGSCAFGIDCNCLKNPDSEFLKYAQKAFHPEVIDLIKFAITLIVPKQILCALKFSVTKPEVTKFFLDLVKKVVKYREENKIFRRDFMHLLLQLKNRGTVTDDENLFDETGKKGDVTLTINELAAQVFVFFLAGFETSSTTMTFALYELATNPEVQEKARAEVLKVLEDHNGNLSYEAVMELKYLDRLVQETLRKYPPLPALQRECNKDYKVPNSDLIIKKGVKIEISLLGIHHDPEYYPDPEKFEPDRFTEENKAKRPNYTWMPFGEGPRLCIGLRFGMIQSKVGLATILKNYKVTLNEKTIYPLVFDTNSFILSPKGGLWVNLQKI